MKQLLLIWLVVSLSTLSAHIYDDLIGQKQSDLNRNLFVCKAQTCTVSEFRYFNNPLLGNTIETVETYSDHEGVVYKVVLHIPNTRMLRNRDIVTAVFDAIKHHTGDGKNLVYSMDYQHDKYGNRTVITLADAKRQQRFIKHLEADYLKAFKSYKTRLSPTVK